MISRRDFLKVAGATAFAVAAAGMMTGCSTPTANPVIIEKKTFENLKKISEDGEFTIGLKDGKTADVKIALKRGADGLFVVVEEDKKKKTSTTEFFLEQNGAMQKALNTEPNNHAYLYANTRSVCGVKYAPMEGSYTGDNRCVVAFLADEGDATLYFTYTYKNDADEDVVQNFKMAIPAAE